MWNKNSNFKDFPGHQLKVVYDTDDNVLFGNKIVKAKVKYNYVPAEFMEEGIPLIVSTSILFDGIGNKDLPNDALMMTFTELSNMFTLNQFEP